MNITILYQLGIAVLGLAAVAMALSKNERARAWAPLLGLAAQPFWFLATVPSEQWGMVALCVAYTMVYLAAAWRLWVEPMLAEVEQFAFGVPAELSSCDPGEWPEADDKALRVWREVQARNAAVTRDRSQHHAAERTRAGMLSLPVVQGADR